MPTVIDKLKVMGGPPPMKSSASPPMATLKASRPLQSMLSIEKSYSLLLGGGKLGLDYGGVAPTPATRRLECLQRVRQANFGMSSMDSREEDMEDSSQQFVLCGLSVGTNESKPAHTEHNLTGKRVGHFKSSVHEIYKARHNNKSMKHLCEPGPANVSEKEEFDRNGHGESIPSLQTAPIHAFSPTSTSKKSSTSCGKSGLELTGRNFRGAVNVTDEWDPYDFEDTTLAKTPKRAYRMTRREYTTDQLDSVRGQQAKELKNCLQVSRSKDTPEMTGESMASSKICSNKEIKVTYNNPYRNLKQKERQALATNRRYEFTSVQSYINFNRTYHHQNDKHVTLPKSILRVPNPCSDTFLLQMMCEMNKPRSRTFTNLYAENLPQREWDESLLTGRAATSHGKLAISAYRQVPLPLARSSKTNMDEFLDYYYWSESDVKDDTDKESDKE